MLYALPPMIEVSATDERPLPSPCVSVCELDPVSGFCKGCWRTVDEIARWSALDNPGKLAVLERLRERRRAAGLTGGRRVNRRRSGETLTVPGEPSEYP
jgi:predicted Fe-S protein YdhL (DUF1289 family)